MFCCYCNWKLRQSSNCRVIKQTLTGQKLRYLGQAVCNELSFIAYQLAFVVISIGKNPSLNVTETNFASTASCHGAEFVESYSWHNVVCMSSPVVIVAVDSKGCV